MQGSMVPVFQCLETLKSHFSLNIERENIQSCSRKRWDQSDLAYSPFANKERPKNSGDSTFQHQVEGSALPGIMILFKRKKINFELHLVD